jgi:hypothetical protein
MVKQGQIRGVRKAEPVKLIPLEPSDGVVLFGLAIDDRASPTTRDPHGEVQAGFGIDPSQDGSVPEVFEFDPEFLDQFPPQRVLRLLASFDVTTGKVPHVWEPPPVRRPMAQEDLVLPSQDCCDDLVVLH